MKLKIHIIGTIVPLLYSICAFASSDKVENMYIPKVTNFDKSVYGGANQIWSIAKDKENNLYFANSLGLISYDGQKWSNHTNESGSSVFHSVCISTNQEIYAGARNDFGYWTKERTASKISFHSLTKQFKLRLKDENVWNIVQYHDDVYFQTYENIYRYNTRKKTLSITTTPYSFQYIAQVNGKIYVQEKERGLMELKEDKLTLIPEGEAFISSAIYGMVSLSPNSILIATIDKGLYEIDEDNNLDVCDFPCNDFLIKNQVLCLARLHDGNLAFGTIMTGLIITNPKGEILTTIDKQKGLANNTILSICSSDKDNIWLGLDKGICNIQINRSIMDFPNPKGLIGTIYDVQEENGNIYFATSLGLYYSTIANLSHINDKQNFKLLANTEGQAWSLQKLGKHLYCCHSKGVYMVDGNQGHFIYQGSSVINLTEINSNIAIFKAYNGLYVLRAKGGSFTIKTWIGYVFFTILILITIYLLNKGLRARLKRQKSIIANEHEKELSKIENQILQEKIELQKEELMRLAKTMLRNTKLVNKLDAEIQKISENKSIPAANLRGLKSIVESNRNPEDEWKIFEMSFNNTYNNYLMILSTKFPSLTTSDLKLAAYIRMNISSKEISSLLNISPKSTEMARYRLRKKLELDHDQNLTAFLMNIK